MNAIKDKLLTNWHFMRIFRLAVGVMMLVAAFQSKDWMIGAFSAFFLYQAVSDTGCCGSQGCAPSPRRRDATATAGDEVVDYEEIK